MLTRRHHQRLREVYRSSGWPCHDMLEAELLAGGWLIREFDAQARETLRLSDAGVAAVAAAHDTNKRARDAHEVLVERVAREMSRAGQVVWTRLALHVPVALDRVSPPLAPASDDTAGGADGDVADAARHWSLSCPDVFCVRHTSVPAYLEPTVYEIKVRRADLLSDLKKPAKRAAYLGLGSACWYVLGVDAKGRPIARADEVPPECGVMLSTAAGLDVLRAAPRGPRQDLPFAVWMALARAAPWRDDSEPQARL